MSNRNELTPRAQKMFPVIEKYLSSSLPQRAFCTQEGLTYSTFHFWLKKYRRQHSQTTNSPYAKGFIPFYVNRYIRPKYARPRDEGIAIGLLPSRPIEKGIAGPGLLAHIAISKFVDHLPLYRQIQQFKRQGVELAESTLCGWVEATCNLLLPLYRVQRDLVLQACYLQVDETTIKVLDLLKKGTTHTGYYWVYPVR